MTNLSLYAVNAFIILDTDGHRVLAKYYNPKGQSYLGGPNDFNKGLHSLKEQRAFEKGLFQKTKKAGGACISPMPHCSRGRLMYPHMFLLRHLMCRRDHSLRRSSSSLQTFARPYLLHDRRFLRKRAHVALCPCRLFRGSTHASSEPGREASGVRESGFACFVSGRDN